MRNQLHYTETFTEPQVLFSMILEKVTNLYQKYVPNFVQNRRNVSLQKQSNTVIIASVLWVLMEEHKNQSAAYRAIRSNLFKENFPEQSCFCRICQNLPMVLVYFKVQKKAQMDYTVSDETYRRLVQMSHLHYTVKSHHLQWNVRQLCQICHHFYQNYCPDSFKHRRNVSLAKVSDESILVLLLLQAELGITSQRHFYSICHLFPCGQLLERSRFNRRSKQLIWLVQL